MGADGQTPQAYAAQRRGPGWAGQTQDDWPKATNQNQCAQRLINATTLADHKLVTSAKREAEGSMSRKTKKPVKDSQVQLTVSGQMMAGLVANFSFTGSPQIDDHRIFELARYHLMAFFFFHHVQQGHGTRVVVAWGISAVSAYAPI